MGVRMNGHGRIYDLRIASDTWSENVWLESTVGRGSTFLEHGNYHIPEDWGVCCPLEHAL